MVSTYSNQDIIFTDTLKTNSITKGSVLSNDGNGNYLTTAPTSNGQILTSNSASPSGVSWENNTAFTSFGMYNQNAISIPPFTGSRYFLVDDGTVPRTIALISSTALTFAVTPSAGAFGAYAVTPTNITGGTVDFTLGFVPANTENLTANWTAYAGGPHFQINATSINTVATSSTSFLAMIDIDVTTGQQVCWQITNNMTQSANPAYTVTIGTFTQFVTR